MASKRKAALVPGPGWTLRNLNWERGCDSSGHIIRAGRDVVSSRYHGLTYCIPCAVLQGNDSYLGCIIAEAAK